MTEKRAQYRKKQKRDNLSKLLKRAKQDQNSKAEDVNVNPDFVKDNKSEAKNVRQDYQLQQDHDLREQKVSRLKKRLNWAIVIVIVLIIIVLVALFNF